MNPFSRTQFVLGASAMEKLKNARVAVFGVGGVGGHAVDALARAGVGTLDLIDSDTISVTNINRQLLATHSSCLCLWLLFFEQITITLPFLLITLHLSHIGFTDGLTFILISPLEFVYVSFCFARLFFPLLNHRDSFRVLRYRRE